MGPEEQLGQRAFVGRKRQELGELVPGADRSEQVGRVGEARSVEREVAELAELLDERFDALLVERQLGDGGATSFSSASWRILLPQLRARDLGRRGVLHEVVDGDAAAPRAATTRGSARSTRDVHVEAVAR